MLAKKSFLTRAWMASGKKVYYWVTRDVLRFTDREGGGARLVEDAPRIAASLKAHPQVRETVVVAFPDRRVGTGLYAFVEASLGLTEDSLREFIAAEALPRAASNSPPRPPEHLQVIEEMPRGASGEVRSEILQLVAMNQVDLIEPLLASEQRARRGRPHRRRPPQPARPLCVLARRCAPAASPRARSAIAAARARSRPARTGRSRPAPCARASAPASATGSSAGMTSGDTVRAMSCAWRR